ncbi:MAG: CusA/CzcA family heavy metal efflux RND transporter [Victivallales bacterium]
MLNWIIDASMRNRLFVCVLGIAVAAVGIRALTILPIDAFPDTTPVQVQVNTVAPSLNPEEIEAQITIPVESAIGGLPGLINVRSISKFGLSQIVATFDDRTSILDARQLVSERLQEAELPEGLARPQLGPISTGLGEIFHYVVRSDNPQYTLLDLREIQDWIIKLELRKVPGVAEINSWGGFEKQYHVVADTNRLIKYSLTLEKLIEALEENNQNVGGGQITRSGEALLVHGVGLTTTTEEIGNIVISTFDGVPVRVHDVATVQIGSEIRRGATTSDGKGEVVLGLGFMLMGENSAVVAKALKAKLAEVQKALPHDVKVEVLYDRTELVDNVIRTVEHNLLFGALLVVIVLFAFLGNMRAGLIVAAAIPLSMLFAGTFMLEAGIAASLLSLGAIDFGLIVDGSVVMMENMMRRLADRRRELGRDLADNERLEILRSSPMEVVRPVVFGVGIILIVFLPVLTLEGIEGKLFKPMALTFIFALVGSILLALTVVPVLATFFLPRRIEEKEPALARIAHRIYEPFLDFAMRHRVLTLTATAMLVAISVFPAMRIGGEFLPKLGEGAIVCNMVRLAGISVNESAAQNLLLEQALKKNFPDEIEHIWTRIGTAEVATDPMGVELADIFISLKPRSHWKKASSQSELADKMRAITVQIPGMRPSFTQPIEMRLNEMIAGIRSDIGIKIFGDDLTELRRLAEEVQAVLVTIRGVNEVNVEQVSGQPVLQVKVNPQAIERFGVSTRNVLNVVEAVGGIKVGEVREGQRRFDMVVRLPDRQRADPDALAGTLIPSDTGPVLPLNRVAQITETEGPSTINREWGKRRITVQCNVRGRDVAGFVAEAKQKISEKVKMPENYIVEWGGQFENMERANSRLLLVVPMALGLILILLFFSLGSMRDVLIVSTGIPLGAIGGIFALWLRGMPFTVSAGIGFVALSGVAILNGLVLVTFIRQRLESDGSVENAVRNACLVRLRPVLMTALVAAAGFIPMAVNTGVGGEIQRPLATVVIGGILTNTLLTLVLLPVLYSLFGRKSGEGTVS